MGTLRKRELDALVEEAIVDAYDDDEQTTGFAVTGSEWIAAYHYWLTGAQT